MKEGRSSGFSSCWRHFGVVENMAMICQIAPFTLLYRFNINRMLELQMDDDVLREREKGEEVGEREEERKRERKEALDDSKA